MNCRIPPLIPRLLDSAHFQSASFVNTQLPLLESRFREALEEVSLAGHQGRPLGVSTGRDDFPGFGGVSSDPATPPGFGRTGLTPRQPSRALPDPSQRSFGWAFDDYLSSRDTQQNPTQSDDDDDDEGDDDYEGEADDDAGRAHSIDGETDSSFILDHAEFATFGSAPHFPISSPSISLATPVTAASGSQANPDTEDDDFFSFLT